ncbi:MAG: stage II sporulation protein D [Bacillota bacterium]
MRKLLVGLTLLIIAIYFSHPYLVNWLGGQFVRQAGPEIKLYLHEEDRIIELPLEEYLVGVVAAEMPAGFPAEALKAQAVAARTYVMKRVNGGGVSNSLHSGAHVCDDHRHTQAWISREEMRERWGMLRYYDYYYKIRRAVDETAGEVIVYQGDLIDPVYHSSCGGHTENSEDVWKFAIPYLRSVACPYNADPNPERTAGFSPAQLDQALGTSLVAVPALSKALEVTERTSTGRPKTVRLGDQTMPATVVRERLGLRSTNFTWDLDGDNITFATTGYGHGVGLCQYGAKGLAQKGGDYREILTHYYTGVSIVKQ